MSYSMFDKYTEKLGIRDPSAILKAKELYRVLITKPIAKTITDVAQSVLCLDLAATDFGLQFDKATAIKLTGVRKTVYQNNLNNVEKALDLDKVVTVAELSIQLGTPELTETAETILQKYVTSGKKINDINHPQYITVAIYAASKVKNVKVDKSKLVAASRLKSTIWKDLAEEFVKFASSIGLSNSKKSIKNIKFNEGDDIIIENTAKQTNCEESVEEYEVWKERIIKAATQLILSGQH